MAAVMTLLAAIAAAALAPANNPASNRPALACGSTPGACPNPSGLPNSTGDHNIDL
jgi:hypothetical protein